MLIFVGLFSAFECSVIVNVPYILTIGSHLPGCDFRLDKLVFGKWWIRH